MNTNQFANSPGRSSTSISRSFNRTYVTANEDRHVTCSDVLLAEQLHIRGLDHGISSFNGANEPLGLNHSECF
jgi:hypothetical protein